MCVCVCICITVCVDLFYFLFRTMLSQYYNKTLLLNSKKKKENGQFKLWAASNDLSLICLNTISFLTVRKKYLNISGLILRN